MKIIIMTYHFTEMVHYTTKRPTPMSFLVLSMKLFLFNHLFSFFCVCILCVCLLCLCVRGISFTHAMKYTGNVEIKEEKHSYIFISLSLTN